MYPAYAWTDSYPHHADPRAKDMKMNLSPPNPLQQPWPYGGSYPYHVPHEYHGCCNPSYYGGNPYGFRPHYAHYPPPPFYPHGYYSPFPPQYYAVEPPKYDYDKHKKNQDPLRCGVCDHKDDDKIKEESQVDKKTSDSLVPLLLRDRPDYPIMWVPHDYMRNADSNAKETENFSHDPVPVEYLEPSKQDGKGEMAHGGDGNRFPFQIFWLPSKNDEAAKDANDNTHDLMVKNNLLDNKTTKNECLSSADECKATSKHAVQKVIPVKQGGASTNDEKINRKSTETVVSSDSVEKKDNSSRASPKTSKLPPVCLRIDPVPRKKKISRSPSPTEKERSGGSPINDPKSSQQQAQVFQKSMENQNEGNIKTVDHANKVKHDNLAAHGDNVQTGNEDSSVKGKMKEKKNLSENEAAFIIQSAYRGFEVRKSQPIKKLRQIYEVQKQVFELRNRIQDLESSSSIVPVDGKQQAIIGETIMSLLLKLDTIQGLHSFVRDVRKSVTKELVGLQEKLDSLIFEKYETPKEKSDQAHAQLSSGVNHEHEAVESQYDDAIQDKLNQALTEDTVKCEILEVEAAKSHEGFGEPQPESDNAPAEEKFDQAPIECNEGIGLCETPEAEARKLQGDSQIVGEPELESQDENVDQAANECDEAMRLCDTHKEKLMNQQIRELTARVKELEKKLLKKKKTKANKRRNRRSVGFVFENDMIA